MTTPAHSSGSIRVEKLRREYAEHVALDDVSLDVMPGEFLTLLGPSGSGKSTLLHLIAGLGEATSGRILIDDADVTELQAQKRGIGLVFQSYALFPHLTARGNIEFPLTVSKGMSTSEREARVQEILELVHLAPQAGRHPAQLSGGQQQRVAVGRALSGSPRVLLLDEPLGALDRKLRHQLGRDLRRIQQETHVTTIYVTHDQEEAFLMSDRIAVMSEGQIQQIGTPEEIYFNPVNTYVASFIGEINLFGVAAGGASDAFRLQHSSASADLPTEVAGRFERLGSTAEAVIGVRPESIKFAFEEVPRAAGSVYLGHGPVLEQVFQGSARRLTVDVGTDEPVKVLNFDSSTRLEPGQELHLSVPAEKVVVLSEEGPK